MAVKKHGVHWDVSAKDGTGPAFASVERNMGRVTDAGSRMAQTFRAVLGATVMAGLTTEMARAAIEAEKASNRLNAVIRATGGAAGVARKEIDVLADSLASGTLFDDDAFRNAAAELVKFGNIHGDVFRGAMRLSADLASFMGTDVPKAAQMIGRALQSPTEGITMLEGEFGKLSEAEEDHINTLVRQGRAVEAQNAVLELLQKRVGGAAETMNTGLTKATGDLSEAWGELMETVGANGTLFNDTLGGATQLLKDIKGEMEGTRTPLRDLAADSLEWVAVLRHVPGVIGLIGTTAWDARQRMLHGPARQSVKGTIIGGPGDLFDVEAFESAHAATPARGVTLGGRPTGRGGGGSTKQQTQDLDAHVRLYKEARAESERIATNMEEVAELWGKVHSGQVSFIEDDPLFKIEEATSQIWDVRDALREADTVGQELGFTFTSAFEDAIVGGKELQDVLRGIVMDVGRIALRKSVTEPMAAGLSEIFKSGVGGLFGRGGLFGAEVANSGTDFGGGRAGGGPVSAGKTFLVGEEGPELLHMGSSGSITPNHALGGETIVIQQTVNLHGDFRAAVRSEIGAMLPHIAEASRQAVAEARARGGR